MGRWIELQRPVRYVRQLFQGDFEFETFPLDAGEFQHNCIEGKGKKTLPDGSWFEVVWDASILPYLFTFSYQLPLRQGQFHDSELEGRGTFHWPDGGACHVLWPVAAMYLLPLFSKGQR